MIDISKCVDIIPTSKHYTLTVFIWLNDYTCVVGLCKMLTVKGTCDSDFFSFLFFSFAKPFQEGIALDKTYCILHTGISIN